MVLFVVLFFCNDTPPTNIYTYAHTLSLHDALPIYQQAPERPQSCGFMPRREMIMKTHRASEQGSVQHRQAQADRPIGDQHMFGVAGTHYDRRPAQVTQIEALAGGKRGDG